MSFSAKFQIGKKTVNLVYGAEKLPLAMSTSKRERARELRNQLARTKTRYLFNVQNAGEGIDMWWSADERGVSFAACIDGWFNDRRSSDPSALADYVVVISSATQLYVADVRGGSVQSEWVVSESVARTKLEKYQAEGTVIYGFTTGDQPGAIDEYVRLDTLPFTFDDANEYTYQRPVIVYLRYGMFHPAILYPLTGLALAAGIIVYGQDIAREFLGGGVSDEISTQPVILQTEFGASVLLGYLANYIPRAESLYADGLTRLQFDYPASLTLSGQSQRYPSQARQFAEQSRGQFTWNSGGWTINMNLSIPRMVTARPPETHQTLEELMSSWPDLELIDGPNVAGATAQTLFSISKANITTYDLVEWAARLDGYPAYLRKIECMYDQYLLTECSLSIDTTTL